jgi:hypothetical protein
MEKPGHHLAGLQDTRTGPTPYLPAVMMTMMVTNRRIGRSNRTHQNSERDNRKQNATNLHKQASPRSALHGRPLGSAYCEKMRKFSSMHLS